MKNVTLSLLAAAAISTISIGSVSAMPVNNLAGLGEATFRMYGDATTRGAPIAHVPIMRSVTTISLATMVCAGRCSRDICTTNRNCNASEISISIFMSVALTYS